MATPNKPPSNEPVTGGFVYRPRSENHPLVGEKIIAPAIVRRAAWMIANGEKPTHVAAKLGRSVITLRTWTSVFKATFDEALERSAESAQRMTLGQKTLRALKLQEQFERIENTILQRSQDVTMQGIPGGDQGTIARDIKSVGSGEFAEKVEIYKFDAALSKEYRDTLEQFAREAGDRDSQRNVGVKVDTADGGSVSIVIIDGAPRQLK